MGERCAIVGRQRGISPSPFAFDDGAISVATLQCLGAEKVYDNALLGPTVPSGVVGCHAGTQRTSGDGDASQPLLDDPELQAGQPVVAVVIVA